MNSGAKPYDGPRSQRWLTVGLCLIATILIVQGGTNGVVVMRAERGALRTYRDSLASIEYLTQIDRDINAQRILVDDHIFERETVNMSSIEAQLASLDRAIGNTGARYGRLTELPHEGKLWQRAQVLWRSFAVAKGRALSFSRKLDDDRARAAMTDVLDEYRELENTLSELLMINRQVADQAIDRVAVLQAKTQTLMWALRIIALLAIMVLGIWGRRAIAAYERRILEDARVLEERNRDLDAFAGRVAHDLKNALAPVAMTPELLRRSPADAKRVLEIAGRSERGLHRVVGMLEALLAFARASESGGADQSAPLEPVLRNVLEELVTPIERVDATIEVEPIPDMRVRCDPDLLHIVLANVCGNAVKFLAGRNERRVRISVHEQDGSCRIEIEDTGPGIPEAARPHIFEPFYRGADVRAPGTGIGLATVRRVVEARGGRVSVESVEGRGSCFRIWLPRAAPAQDRSPAADGEVYADRST